MKKRLLPLLMAFSLLFSAIPSFAEEPETEINTPTFSSAEEPTLAAETAVLMDAASGEVLYEKNANQKMYPASITKLMTILLALEHGKLTDEITFSQTAVSDIEEGSAHIAITEGETLKLEQVLRAIILRSANEASNGVAEYVDGSIEAFAKHMNERAKELGCKNTHFVNANGLHNENHYTTAYDMALIAKELLAHEEYRSIMSETDYEIPPTNKQTETRFLHGQHQMLNPNSIYYYEDATGGKTGFTSEALNTLVTYAKRDDIELIAVVMKCNGAEHYTDTAALFEYGFENFEPIKLFSVGDHTVEVKVTETYQDKPVELGTITAAPAEDATRILPKDTQTSQIKVETDCPESIEAPVKVGQTVGTLKVTLNGKTIQTVDMVARNSIDAMTEEQKAALDRSAFFSLLKKIALGIGVLALAFLILLCITRTIGRRQRQKRRQLRQQLPPSRQKRKRRY